MGLMSQKKGIVMGVVNEFSIAAAIARFLAAEGASIGLSHLPDNDQHGRMKKRVMKVAGELGVDFVRPCDVSRDQDITDFFKEVKEHFGAVDFVVHSIAYAPLDDLRCQTVAASREGFNTAMNISVYSFIAVARAAATVMVDGGSLVTLSFFGGEKVVDGYNMMGVCKAALEMATRYLARDLGPQRIRVNAISAGPVKTLSASAIGDISRAIELTAAMAPMGRNITVEEKGKASAYLLSDLASGTTGEILHVDCGYNIMGSPGPALSRLGLSSL